mmetsp:Transcript_40220/g.86260  ORF Transcript_40220/g.86260 Transcript_40220/m.86260 type:complete len:414 (-) Transcript_40220:2830-4071(-)
MRAQARQPLGFVNCRSGSHHFRLPVLFHLFLGPAAVAGAELDPALLLHCGELLVLHEVPELHGEAVHHVRFRDHRGVAVELRRCLRVAGVHKQCDDVVGLRTPEVSRIDVLCFRIEDNSVLTVLVLSSRAPLELHPVPQGVGDPSHDHEETTSFVHCRVDGPEVVASASLRRRDRDRPHLHATTVFGDHHWLRCKFHLLHEVIVSVRARLHFHDADIGAVCVFLGQFGAALQCRCDLVAHPWVLGDDKHRNLVEIRSRHLDGPCDLGFLVGLQGVRSFPQHRTPLAWNAGDGVQERGALEDHSTVVLLDEILLGCAADGASETKDADVGLVAKDFGDDCLHSHEAEVVVGIPLRSHHLQPHVGGVWLGALRDTVQKIEVLTGDLVVDTLYFRQGFVASVFEFLEEILCVWIHA